jgi:hypothetical protein
MEELNFIYLRFKILSIPQSDWDRAGKLFQIIQVFSKYNFENKIITHLGDQAVKVHITQEAIFNYLIKVKKQFQAGNAVPIILSNESKDFNVIFTEEYYEYGVYDCLWFSLNSLIPEFPFINNLNAILNLLKDLFNTFAGIYAYTEDERLLQTYFAKRSYNKILEKVPDNLKQFIPKPDYRAIEKFNIPSLFLINEIPLLQFPSGIWWINFFNIQQIKNLGIDNNISDWAIVEKISETIGLYVLTKEILDITNVQHLKKLQQVIHNLNLVEVQQNYLK